MTTEEDMLVAFSGVVDVEVALFIGVGPLTVDMLLMETPRNARFKRVALFL